MTTHRLLRGASGLLLAGPVAASNLLRARERNAFYVAPDGEGPTHGTPERPFATLPHAYARAGAGDTSVLQGGLYGFGGRTSG
ncbi:hypothetical protein [Methylorubrum extorquens]|uniref:hypothetical protein n=1 Tax=Methylorubrum extorquens TaxID=408 RepID=UPI000158F611|nr:hypothetical protein [Methylorubrum extorquens]ABY31943.1 hypothetical protein Mext_3563 [Methylorubrum extorquens PA1]KQP93878.1 hypothetical protein ASF55_18225 [Methylobacterium sp. Leaf119]WIU38551.1 hypothetical protein KQ926_18375 [Methylorubrum extorquens]